MLVNGASGDLISIRDRGLLYGDGVFRTMRARNARVPDWSLHFEKLQSDCARLAIPCPDYRLLSRELSDLLGRHPDSVIKLVVTRGIGERGYRPSVSAVSSRFWDASPLPGVAPEWATEGVQARICALRLGHQPALAGIKHLNRLENVLAAAEWDDPAIAEGLLLDELDNVICGTRSNLFLITNKQVITPELSRCGVAGVQRSRVMLWANRHEYTVQVRDVAMSELYNADELFLVNSIIGLWPIRQLEQSCWASFPIAMQIRRHLEVESE